LRATLLGCLDRRRQSDIEPSAEDDWLSEKKLKEEQKEKEKRERGTGKTTYMELRTREEGQKEREQVCMRVAYGASSVSSLATDTLHMVSPVA
jgi:hypothetical protein